MDMLIVAVDLGHFKAYRVSKTPRGGSKIMLVESFDSVETHGRLSEKYSDADGRFGIGGGKQWSTTGNGEPHDTELEMEKRVIKLIAKQITDVVKKEQCADWRFAAPKKINNRILENLNADIRGKLTKNVPCNLTKSAKGEVLRCFA